MELPFLTIDQFKTMDHKAIHDYSIPIELMMENAGLQLARLVTRHASSESRIMIGVGTGNNGGGGLVAARRLAGWGYEVHLNIPDRNLKPLPAIQYNRAITFGASIYPANRPDIFVDAFFGFSQRLPLPQAIMEILSKLEKSKAYKISLDLPTGFNKNTLESFFNPHSILTLAALKAELIQSDLTSELYIADIGIPNLLYKDMGVRQPDFSKSGITKFSS